MCVFDRFMLDHVTAPIPRLVLHTVLCLLPESVCLMGPDCSSWGLPARGTSQRNYMNSLGAVHLKWVSDSNVTISRKLGWQL